MLAIRMQRTGRKGHAQFRVIVQDSRFSPASGRVVEYLGSYDPHAKTAQLDKEKVISYLNNGAQPSDRSAQLFKAEGIKLPEWVKTASPKTRSIRHPEKLRRNRPAEESQPEAPAEEAAAEPAEDTEAPVESQTPQEQPATEETPAQTEAENEPAEQPASQEATAEPAETIDASEEPEAKTTDEETS
jgi:small subunit ribosomal protein S16